MCTESSTFRVFNFQILEDVADEVTVQEIGNGMVLLFEILSFVFQKTGCLLEAYL